MLARNLEIQVLRVREVTHRLVLEPELVVQSVAATLRGTVIQYWFPHYQRMRAQVMSVQHEDEEKRLLQEVADVPNRLRNLEEGQERLNLAVFGDPMQPEVHKNAILPTMTRVNTWLDAACWLVKTGIPSGIGVLIALVGFHKATGMSVMEFLYKMVETIQGLQ